MKTVGLVESHVLHVQLCTCKIPGDPYTNIWCFSVFFCFASSSLVLCPTNSSCLTSPNTLFSLSLSLLSKTASCSAVLMILPCGKCDHSVAYLICLFSLTGHSPALRIVCCLTIIVSVFSPVL